MSIEEKKGSGFGGALSKILADEVDRKVPVLAKRKTEAMLATEKEALEREAKKAIKLAKQNDLIRQVKSAADYSAEHEKMLKKVATKGVVALFNAIAVAKREAAENPAPPKPPGSHLTRKEKIARRQQGQINKKLRDESGEASVSASSSKADSKWSVLSDDIKSLHKRQKPSNSSGNPSKKRKTGNEIIDNDD